MGGWVGGWVRVCVCVLGARAFPCVRTGARPSVCVCACARGTRVSKDCTALMDVGGAGCFQRAF